MGGPCRLRNNSKEYLPGPACTDNFQIITFTYDEKEWQSVEQCYQAQKFRDTESSEKIRLLLPTEKIRGKKQSTVAYGLQMWNMGRSLTSPQREDWDKVKVGLMYEICLAKYKCNPRLQQELLGTGDMAIEGQLSTGWTHPTLGEQNWSYWNGLIQMLCREMLKPEGERNSEALLVLNSAFEKYHSGYT